MVHPVYNIIIKSAIIFYSIHTYLKISCIALFTYRQTETAGWCCGLQISRENAKLSPHYAKLEKLAVTSRALITLVDVHDLSLLWPPQCESCVCVVHRLPPDMQWYCLAIYIIYSSHCHPFSLRIRIHLDCTLNRLSAKWWSYYPGCKLKKKNA